MFCFTLLLSSVLNSFHVILSKQIHLPGRNLRTELDNMRCQGLAPCFGRGCVLPLGTELRGKRGKTTHSLGSVEWLKAGCFRISVVIPKLGDINAYQRIWMWFYRSTWYDALIMFFLWVPTHDNEAVWEKKLRYQKLIVNFIAPRLKRDVFGCCKLEALRVPMP